jgi:uncharacterized protein
VGGKLAAVAPEAAMSEVLQALYRGDAEGARRLAAGSPGLDLFEAAALGSVDRLETLLAADPASARAFAPDGFTALQLAAFFGQPAAVRILLQAGADPNAVSRNDMRIQPLHAATANGNPETIRLLVDAGADPNARQKGGFTPLQARAQCGDAAMVRLLLDRGADPLLRSDDGRSAADLARQSGHPELAALLEVDRA